MDKGAGISHLMLIKIILDRVFHRERKLFFYIIPYILINIFRKLNCRKKKLFKKYP